MGSAVQTTNSTQQLTDEEKKKLAEEFIKTVESKLKKEENHIWMLRDYDHLQPNR